jgi:MoaA/NifB/PqqE/SkfB family radical SAM enzyme
MLLPDSLQIGTIDFCNRKCSWCPESYLGKTPDRIMPMDMYEHILDDLSKSKYLGKLHLYLMNEPLCDPRIHDMIKMARSKFPVNIIFISTNGDGLNGIEDVQKLFESGLTWMAISNYDDQDRFREYQKIYHNVAVTSLKEPWWQYQC